MNINSMEMIVAQNCPWFNSKYPVSMAEIRDFTEGCSSCSYYSGGQCSKELFEELRDKIRIN